MPSFIVAPSANFDGSGNLTSLSGALLRTSASLNGLTNAVQYRATVLSEASDPFTPVAEAGVLVPIPTGFSWTTSGVNFYRNDSGVYSSDFDPSTKRITTSANIYLSPTGSDAADGTIGAPKASLAAAMTAANAGGVATTIHAAAGEYGQAGTGTPVTATVPLEIICADASPAIFGQTTIETGWTNTGGSYPNLWQKTVTGTAPIWAFDYGYLDEDGNPSSFRRTTQATANSTAEGGCYISGQTIYVRLPNGRQPDADVRVIRSADGLNFGNMPFYIENIRFFGALNEAIKTIPSGAQNRCMVNCRFGYAYDGDVSSLDGQGIIIVDRCHFVWSRELDGANYHNFTALGAVELNCIGAYNGMFGTGQTNNGSTAHDDRRIIRMNGYAHHNKNRQFHDIGDGTEVWMMGCRAGNATSSSVTPVDRAAFMFGRDGFTETTEAWLDGCSSLGGVLADLGAYAGTNVHTRNMDISGWTILGTGTLSTY